MPESSYDVVVIGDELAGLVSATLCASRGLRVLLVETGRTRWTYKLGPYQLPAAPLPLCGISGPAATRVIEELHFQHLLKRKLADTEPPLQLIGPDVRLDVGADPLELSQEIERELGAGSGAAELFAGAEEVAATFDPLFSGDLLLPSSGFFERREMSRLEDRVAAAAAAWPLDDAPAPLRSLAALPAWATAHLPADAVPTAAVARALSLWRRGAPRLPGDASALRDIFLDKFTSHNGERRTGLPAAIQTGWNKVTGVVLESGEEIGANHVVAAMPAGELCALMGKKAPKRLRQIDAATAPAGYRYTLHLVIDEVGVPEGMGDAVLCVFDPAKPLEGENAIALYLDRPDDRARVVVSAQALCPVPPDGTSLSDAFARLRRELRSRIETVMPFYGEHILTVHSPVEATAALGYEERVEPMPAPPVWRCELAEPEALAALDYGVGTKQLTLASAQILPGLGLEGELVAGWCAARLASASLGKKKDYLKAEVIASR